MKTNLLKAIEEMKEQITSGWSPSEREQFDKFLEEEIKPYWSNLYSLLHGDFEAELLERCRKCEEKPGTPVYCECGLPCYSITIKEILKGDSDGPHPE